MKRECREELRDENGGRSRAGYWKELQRPECEPMGDAFVTPRDREGMRDAWPRIEEVWSGTIERAQRMPEAALHERVDEEWSFVETLRHLLFVTDAWVRRTILSEAHAYHRLALPPDDDVDVRPWGIDVTAKPSFADVLTARLGFTRICAPNPAPGFPPQATLQVGLCLSVVAGEEWAHHGYAVRDLAVLETRTQRD